MVASPPRVLMVVGGDTVTLSEVLAYARVAEGDPVACYAAGTYLRGYSWCSCIVVRSLDVLGVPHWKVDDASCGV